MTRINHAATARGAISQASNLLTVHEDVAAGAMATIAVAHATLALVEQQRIANILATAHVDARYFENEKIAEFREELGL